MATMQGIQSPARHAPSAPPAEKSDELPAASGSVRERLARRWGKRLLEGLFSKRRAIIAELRAIPERMQKVTNQARLMMELADDFRSGRYRRISWVSIAIAAAALVYAVSPADVVPDALPGLGAFDDMVVLTVAMHLVERDLKAYCRFRGYSESDYF
jgi:uncharacterized membrane protein YkvA (DUF1232 family)